MRGRAGDAKDVDRGGAVGLLVWLVLAAAAAGQPLEPNPLRSSPQAAVLPAEAGQDSAAVPASAVAAEPVPAGQDVPSPPAVSLTLEDLQLRREALEGAVELDPAVRVQLRAQYTRAEDWLRTAAEAARQLAVWQTEIEQAPSLAAEARQQLAQPPVEAPAEIPPETSLEELRKAAAAVQEELRLAREELAQREADLKLRERRTELARLSEEVAKQAEEVEAQLAAPPPPAQDAALTLARRTELQARRQTLEQQRQLYETEAQRLDAVGDLFTLRRDLAQRRVSQLEKRLELWQAAEAERRRTEAREQLEDALSVAEESRTWRSMDPALDRLAERAGKLAEQRAELADKLEAVAKEVEENEKTSVHLRREQERTREKVDAAGLSSTIGLMLRKQREQLPPVAELQERREFVASEMPKYAYDEIELREEREAIGDLDSSLESLRASLQQPLPDARWAAIADEVRDVLQRRRETLDELLRDYDAYLETLSDLEFTTSRLYEQVNTFAEYIDERILWIRSTQPLSFETLRDAWSGLQQLLVPGRWLAALSAAFSQSTQQPIWTVGLLLLWGALFLLRRGFRRRLQQLVRPLDESLFHTASATLEAVLVTVGIAAPWPLLVWLAAWMLSHVAAAAQLATATAPARGAELLVALGAALFATAYVYWPMELLRQVFRSQGLAEAHLGWDPATAGLVRRVVRRLMVGVLPLVLLVSLTEACDEEQWRDSLGRLVFIASLLVMGLVLYRGFRPGSLLFESLFAAETPAARYRWRLYVFVLTAGPCLVLAGLSATGFHYSARQLTVHLINTLWLLLAVLFIRSLFARWLFIRQWKLARQMAEERTADARPTLQDDQDDALEPTVLDKAKEALRKEQERRLVTIDLQLQQLLKVGTAAALLLGLWMIWSGMLPALRALDRIRVWPLEEAAAPSVLVAADAPPPAVDAAPGAAPEASLPPTSDPARQAPLRGTTLGDLLLTLLIAALTIAAGKNLPGLLEVALLERLPMDRGARNAVTTLSGYVIMLVGLLVGANAIGLRWQNIQWLAAALTVGLGFGLQEIFANFVSGLILLFERPIRVGDIITLGDLDGTVTKIRIRATTITNWDRKELIVPNKELITGRLLNWTLSDQLNRVVITVGVAYGSNIAKVRRLILRIANDHPVVLKEPAPLVTFESFGDSTLNFVLRCYLPNLDNRLTTIHDLNTAIHDRFAREGVVIAFPQLDLHVRSTPPGNALRPGQP